MEFFVLCKTVHRLAVFCLLPFSIGLFGLQCGDVALTHCQNLKLGGCLLLQQFMAWWCPKCRMKILVIWLDYVWKGSLLHIKQYYRSDCFVLSLCEFICCQCYFHATVGISFFYLNFLLLLGKLLYSYVTKGVSYAEVWFWKPKVRTWNNLIERDGRGEKTKTKPNRNKTWKE